MLGVFVCVFMFLLCFVGEGSGGFLAVCGHIGNIFNIGGQSFQCMAADGGIAVEICSLYFFGVVPHYVPHHIASECRIASEHGYGGMSDAMKSLF